MMTYAVDNIKNKELVVNWLMNLNCRPSANKRVQAK